MTVSGGSLRLARDIALLPLGMMAVQRWSNNHLHHTEQQTAGIAVSQKVRQRALWAYRSTEGKAIADRFRLMQRPFAQHVPWQASMLFVTALTFAAISAVHRHALAAADICLV